MQEREDGISDEDDVLDVVIFFEVVRDELFLVIFILKYVYLVFGVLVMIVVILQ